MHQRQCFSVISTVGFSTPRRGVADQDVEPVEMLAELGEDLVDAESGMPTLPWIATARRPSARISAHSASASSALL